MNSLSWMILAIDLIPNLAIIGIFCSVVAIGLAFLLPKNKNIQMFDDDHEPFQGLLRPITYVVFFVGLLLTLLTPSERALYMIAASELGEDIVTSDEGQKVYNKLSDILEELTKSKEK